MVIDVFHPAWIVWRMNPGGCQGRGGVSVFWGENRFAFGVVGNAMCRQDGDWYKRDCLLAYLDIMSFSVRRYGV